MRLLRDLRGEDTSIIFFVAGPMRIGAIYMRLKKTGEPVELLRYRNNPGASIPDAELQENAVRYHSMPMSPWAWLLVTERMIK